MEFCSYIKRLLLRFMMITFQSYKLLDGESLLVFGRLVPFISCSTVQRQLPGLSSVHFWETWFMAVTLTTQHWWSWGRKDDRHLQQRADMEVPSESFPRPFLALAGELFLQTDDLKVKKENNGLEEGGRTSPAVWRKERTAGRRKDDPEHGWRKERERCSGS